MVLSKEDFMLRIFYIIYILGPNYLLRYVFLQRLCGLDLWSRERELSLKSLYLPQDKDVADAAE